MYGYRWILLLGLLLAAGVVMVGYAFFPTKELLLNLTSEAVGILVGGLIVFALLEIHRQRSREKDLQAARDELFQKLYWELELLQFSVQPIASWTVGLTYGEDVRALVTNAEPGPLPAAYFLELAQRLASPLSSIGMEVTPRVISLMDDQELVPVLLRLEQSGRKIQAAAHSRSDTSPESELFRELIDDLLHQAAIAGDCIDRVLHRDGVQSAAQARFDRLRPLGLSESWSSGNRVVHEKDGQPFRPGRLPSRSPNGA
jgi:hypothetical protein